jgi:IclR family pca regulon transcriptional regulator
MIKVLKKADDILGIVAQEKEKATLLDLSRELKIHKATLSHILKAMLELGYIAKSQAKCYSIGPRISALADRALRRSFLQELAAEATGSLSEKLHETCSASVIHNGIRHRIAYASFNRSVTVSVEASMETRGAPYDTATGRLLTAFLDRDNLRLVLKKNGLPGSRWNGINNASAFNKTLAAIRKQGAAFWRSEDGQAEAVAVPVFGPDKQVWAALGIAVPVFRFRGSRREEIIRTLKSSARQMSYNLGTRYGKAGPEHGETEKSV